MKNVYTIIHYRIFKKWQKCQKQATFSDRQESENKLVHKPKPKLQSQMTVLHI